MSKLLFEHQTMLNSGLGARSLWAFVAGHGTNARAPVTLFHLFTVLPLVFHRPSLTRISSRHLASGLRAVMVRDTPESPTVGLSHRLRPLAARTLSSLNIALAARLLVVESGAFEPGQPFKLRSDLSKEAKAVLKAAHKLGGWSSSLSTTEYLTILGVSTEL